MQNNKGAVGDLSRLTTDNPRTITHIFEQRMRHLPQLHRLIALYDARKPGRIISEAWIKAICQPASGGAHYACGSCGGGNNEYSLLAEEFGISSNTVRKAFIAKDCEGLNRFLRITINGKHLLLNKRAYETEKKLVDRYLWLSTRMGVFDVAPALFFPTVNDANVTNLKTFVQDEVMQAMMSIDLLNLYFDENRNSEVKAIHQWYYVNGVAEPGQRAVRAVTSYNRLLAAGHTKEI